MAVVNKIRSLLRQKKGDEAVSFLLTTAMLVLIFVTLISAMIYIMQYINATGSARLTQTDFSSDEEFLKWKKWSDEDYQTTEKAGRGFYDIVLR